VVVAARGLTLTGVGRPVDGGRGRTWVGRWSRRVVIGAIVARPPGAGGWPRPRLARRCTRGCGALYSGRVARV